MKHKQRWLITLFGISLIVGFLPSCWTYPCYKAMHRHMPEWLIVVRFSISVALRALSIISGIGIILRRDIFRKLALALGAFYLSTVFLRHPYYVVSRVFEENACLAGEYAAAPYNLVQWVKAIFLVLLFSAEIAYFGALIYFFTRAATKAEFRIRQRFSPDSGFNERRQG